jgi:hypothetical protein
MPMLDCVFEFISAAQKMREARVDTSRHEREQARGHRYGTLHASGRERRWR